MKKRFKLDYKYKIFYSFINLQNFETVCEAFDVFYHLFLLYSFRKSIKFCCRFSPAVEHEF